MTLIKKQNAIDVYAGENNSSVYILEENGHYNEKEGEFSDAIIEINSIHIDAIIEALQAAKQEILAREAKEA
ncbi:MAG: hypothetical protein ACN6NX_11520 [Acinetobacter sp.]